MTAFAHRMAAGKISPKAVLAFLFPFIATVLGVVATWIVTGDFNAQEVREGLAGLIAAVVALLGAWTGKPGEVVVDRPAPSAVAGGAGL